MTNKVLFFGKEFYFRLFDFVSEIFSEIKTFSFLYEGNNFVKKINKQYVEFDLFDKKMDFAIFEYFDMNNFFEFFFEDLNRQDYFNNLFQVLNITFDDLMENLNISNIVFENKGRSQYYIFDRIKNQFMIFLSFFLKQQNRKKKSSDLHFYIDVLLSNLDDRFDTIFFKWLDREYKMLDYFINRLNFLIKPLDMFFKNNNNIEQDFSHQDIFFNSEHLNKNYTLLDLNKLYLLLDKFLYFRNIVRINFRKYDAIYTSAHINLLDDLVYIQNLFNYSDNQDLGRFSVLSQQTKSKDNNFKIIVQNKIDLIEYYPNLEELDMIVDNRFNMTFLRKILNNPTLKTINLYVYELGELDENLVKYIQKVNKKTTQDVGIKINLLSTNDFWKDDLDKVQLVVEKINSLKYEIQWDKQITKGNQALFPIRALKNTANFSFNAIGGYVNGMFNLSQLGDAWIDSTTYLIDESRVIENAYLEHKSILKNNVIVAGDACITSSKVYKEAIITDQVQVINSKVSDKALVLGETKLIGVNDDRVFVLDSAKINVNNQIIGNVTIRGSANIAGDFNIINSFPKSLIIKGKSLIRGKGIFKGSISIIDNAYLNGVFDLNDDVTISDNARLNANVTMYHNAKVSDNAVLGDGNKEQNILLSGNAKVFDNVKILGNAFIYNDVQVYGNGTIYQNIKLINRSRFYGKFILKMVSEEYLELKDSEQLNDNWIKDLKNHPQYDLILESVKLFEGSRVNTKYRITNYQKIFWSEKLQKTITLYRIQALQTFGDVKKNDYGGFIESEKNLSTNDKSWIYNDAAVFDQAKILGSSKILGDSMIYDNAIVNQNSIVFGSSEVFGSAKIMGNSVIKNHAKVYDTVIISGRSEIKDNAEVFGNSLLFDNVVIGDNVRVYDSKIQGKSVFANNALIFDSNCFFSNVSGSIKINNSDISFTNVFGNIAINGSIISESLIEEATKINQAYIYNSVIRGNSKIKNSDLSKSFISENANIEYSKITYSNILDSSRVQSSLISESTITEFSKINQASINFSFTSGGTIIKESIVDTSKISGDVSIFNSKIVHTSLFGNIQIKKSLLENTKIRGCFSVFDSVVRNFDWTILLSKHNSIYKNVFYK